MADAIFTERLTKHYGSRRVVDSLNLRIPQGSVYGLLGRNGAGKSTTIKMLMGMVQPDSGRAMLLGENIETISNATRARIAYLAEGHPLYGWMTIDEAVKFTRPFYPRWNDTLVDQILDHFELRRKQKFRRLSRGQQAQVSLALAVAPDPELLILDDPTLGLDTVVRRDFLESLIQIIQRQGRTILFSSHILGDVERVADRIGVMVNGVLRVDCRTETFRESVRKLVLEFAGSVPDSVSIPRLVSSRQMGSSLELVVVGYDDAQREAVEALQPLSIEVLDLNLEDAFIEYTRGPRRSLPLFATELENVESARDQGAA
jgi:ABC-2 type transport system ATP-binding protein